MLFIHNQITEVAFCNYESMNGQQNYKWLSYGIICFVSVH